MAAEGLWMSIEKRVRLHLVRQTHLHLVRQTQEKHLSQRQASEASGDRRPAVQTPGAIMEAAGGRRPGILPARPGLE